MVRKEDRIPAQSRLERAFLGLFLEAKHLVIRFGSYRENSDLDFLVAGEDVPVYEQVRIGLIDLTLVPFHDLLFLAAKKDLVVAAPLLNGNVLCDLDGLYQKASTALSSAVNIDDVVEHNLSRHSACRAAALSYMREGLVSGRRALLSLAADSVAWSCSYYLAAQCYLNSRESIPLQLHDLTRLDGGEMISRARRLARDILNVDLCLDESALAALFHDADGLILRAG